MVNKTIPADLVNSIKSGECAFFIGAGLSIGSGLPSWTALMKPMSNQTNFAWPGDDYVTADTFLTIAQYYENSFGRNSLIRYLQDYLEDTNKNPSLVHHALTAFPSNEIFTTNYDSIIERAYLDNGIQTNTIISDEDLPYWKENTVKIIKLCGEIKRPDSIVVTKQDFNLYSETHPRLVERLRSVLESKIVLFLGYSMRDPFINQMWDIIGYSFGRNRRQGYITLFDTNDLEVNDLEKRGIIVIKLLQSGDRTQVLRKWVDDLLIETGISTSGRI